MERTSFAEMRCSLARGLELIGDWWTPLIIRDLFLDVRRFDELAEDLGISRNLLTRRLSRLVANGVIERRPYQSRPIRYDYHLTEAGRDLVPAILALTPPRHSNEYDFRSPGCLSDLPGKLIPIELRKPDVQKQGMRAKDLCQLDCLVRGVGRLDMVTGELEDRRTGIGRIAVIIDDENSQARSGCGVIDSITSRNL